MNVFPCFSQETIGIYTEKYILHVNGYVWLHIYLFYDDFLTLCAWKMKSNHCAALPATSLRPDMNKYVAILSKKMCQHKFDRQQQTLIWCSTSSFINKSWQNYSEQIPATVFSWKFTSCYTLQKSPQTVFYKYHRIYFVHKTQRILVTSLEHWQAHQCQKTGNCEYDCNNLTTVLNIMWARPGCKTFWKITAKLWP